MSPRAREHPLDTNRLRAALTRARALAIQNDGRPERQFWRGEVAFVVAAFTQHRGDTLSNLCGLAFGGMEDNQDP